MRGQEFSSGLIPLVYHPDYDAGTLDEDHRSPKRKYGLVADMLREAGHDFIEPMHAQEGWLRLAHSPSYVSAILNPTPDGGAARVIDFEVTSDIARHSRAVVAGTCLAAHLALEQGIAVNLAGGVHHAGSGVSVFDDVAVAARLLLEEGSVRRIGIIDCNEHKSDGTAAIFADDPRVFTACLYCDDNWQMTKPVSDLDIGLPVRAGDATYMGALKLLVETVLAGGVDFVFFNAGVDTHGDDELGLLSLTDDGIMARDRLVAEACASRRIPLCAVLGRGNSGDVNAVARRHCGLISALTQVVDAAA